MVGQPGFFDVDERLQDISAKGDDLERLNQIVDFEVFRADLERAAPRGDRSKGGRPPYDHILMFKVLILQAATHFRTNEQNIWSRIGCRSSRSWGLRLPTECPTPTPSGIFVTR